MKTFLLILLCLVILVVLIGLIRVRVRVVYGEDGAKVFFKVLFLSFCIYPGEKRKIKPVNAEKEIKKPQKGGELPGVWELIKLGKSVFGKLRRKLSVDLLSADIVTASNDPFKTAMLFGGAGAGVGTLLAILENIFIIKKKEIRVNADFSSQTTKIYLDLKLSLRIYQAIVIGIFAAYQFIKLQKTSVSGDKTKEKE